MPTKPPPEPSFRNAPMRATRFWEPEIRSERRVDGTLVVEQVAPLPSYPGCLTERLEHWAAATPERTFIAERDGDGWRRISYAATLDAARRLGQALLDLELSTERPLVILAGNGIDHALLALAAQYVGVAYAPVSPLYATFSGDFAKLRGLFATLTPGAIFVADAAPFRAALDTIVPGLPVIAGTGDLPGRPVHRLADLAATTPTAAVDTACTAVGPDTIAKFLFTSGSTGTPKGVINTQRMLCANQAMLRDTFAFLADTPPVVIDWAPWNHTASGNLVFNMVLFNGGTFHVDLGRPTPDGIRVTAENIRDVSPNWYFNVPAGYDALVQLMERDGDLREAFYRNLKMLWYAGAGLTQATWDALERMAVETIGERLLLATGLGSTETAPSALACTVAQQTPGNIGLPHRGISLKLVPNEGKLEARLRGPSITPGYWREPDLTAEAFDEEGYYRLGDALRPADPDDLAKGFFFDGRTAENFKLASGTWVAVGALRGKLLDAFAGAARDVVITGHDREYIGALVFPDFQRLAGLVDIADAAPEVLVADPVVRAWFAVRVAALLAESTGSSTAVRRLLLLATPPSFDAGELTEKGSVNQRAALRLRTDDVEALYASTAGVILPDAD